MKIGIDRLSPSIPNLYLNMIGLTESCGDDPARCYIGIDQDQTAVNRANEDTITLRVNTASRIMIEKDHEQIDMVIVGTESGIDHSEASVVIIYHSLRIQSFARFFGVEEACYGGTTALYMVKEYVKNHPGREVLVIASDITRYGLASGGEVTQDAGAVTMMTTQNPRILSIEDDNVFLAENIYDFWHSGYSEFSVVDEPLSNSTYTGSFQKVQDQHKGLSGRGLEDYQAITFHTPYTKIGKKALQSVLDQTDEGDQERLLTHYGESIRHSRRIGNLYTGSLYLGLTSLLEDSKSLQPKDHVGLFSYGSDAVNESFTGYLEENYQEYPFIQSHQEMLDSQKRISTDEYEMVFSESLPEHGESVEYASDVPFSIIKIENNICYYRI